MSEVVLVTPHGSIAQLTLNRPLSYNALNIETAQALTRALLDREPTRRSGASSSPATAPLFPPAATSSSCWLIPTDRGGVHKLATHVHVCVTEIRRLRKPVIAAVTAWPPAAVFPWRWPATSESWRNRRGSSGLHQQRAVHRRGRHLHPAALGRLARALEIAAFDEPIAAEQALAWGLATRVFPTRNCSKPRWPWPKPWPEIPAYLRPRQNLVDRCVRHLLGGATGTRAARTGRVRQSCRWFGRFERFRGKASAALQSLTIVSRSLILPVAVNSDAPQNLKHRLHFSVRYSIVPKNSFDQGMTIFSTWTGFLEIPTRFTAAPTDRVWRGSTKVMRESC